MAPTSFSSDRFIRVFISHKSEDDTLAYRLRDILERRCPQLRCYVAGNDYGADWRSRIENELKEAHVLLLLFTSPARDWDWPLYEVGLYHSLDDRRLGKVIYFHASIVRPGPLQNLQGVKIDSEAQEPVVEFLKQFYRTSSIINSDPPLLPKIRLTEIRTRANEICTAFETALSSPIYPSYRVVLANSRHVSERRSNSFKGIPRDFFVESMTPPTSAIFDRASDQGTWQDLLNNITDEQEWKNELDAEFTRAIEMKTAYPTKSTFRGIDKSRIFRAMITRLDEAKGGVTRVAVTFIPERMPSIVGGPAFNLLRFATRFRTEVIDKYLGELNRNPKSDNASAALQSLKGALNSVELDAQDFKLLDAPTVQAAFSEIGGDRKRVREMFDEWAGIRENLDIAITKTSVRDAQKLLEELQMINLEFLTMIATRHQELIKKDFDTVAALRKKSLATSGCAG